MPNRKLAQLFDRHGEVVTVTTYTQTGTDSYGDPTFATTSTTTGAIIERARQPSSRRTPDGETPNIDITVYLPATVDVEMPSPSTPKPSRIARDSGVTYRVETIFDEANGVVECSCRQLTQS